VADGRFRYKAGECDTRPDVVKTGVSLVAWRGDNGETEIAPFGMVCFRCCDADNYPQVVMVCGTRLLEGWKIVRGCGVWTESQLPLFEAVARDQSYMSLLLFKCQGSSKQF
jgi:hypothetical protein